MDHFFIEIYESVIYQWIVSHQDVYQKSGISFQIDENDPQRLLFTYQDYNGEIYFWKKHHIIEETIKDANNNITFYLHFRIVNLSSTQKFVKDFLKQMKAIKNIQHIGMSCSCGITSSVFVEKLQKLCEMLNISYQFNVVSLDDIKTVYKDYDLLVLAPQIAYLEPKVKAICQKDCLVMCLDASIFATGQYQKALAIIQEKLEKKSF